MRMLLLTISLLSAHAFGQLNMDSLYQIYADESLPDSSRYKAVMDISWELLFVDADSARALAWDAYQLSKDLDDPSLVADALNTYGAANMFLGNLDTALIIFETCYGIYKENDSQFGMINMRNNQATIYTSQGKYDQAIVMYTDALQAYVANGSDRGRANALLNIGNVYLQQEQNETAVEKYAEALKYASSIDDERMVTMACNNIGIAYMNLEDYDSARVYTQKALEMTDNSGDIMNYTYAVHNMGRIYHQTGQFAKAIPYYEESLELSAETKDQSRQAMTLYSLGAIYIEINQVQKGIDLTKKGLLLAQEIGLAEDIKDAAYNLYDGYKKLGQWEDAWSMFDLYSRTLDSLSSEANKEELIRQAYRYEYMEQAAVDSIKLANAARSANAELEAEKSKTAAFEQQTKQSELAAQKHERQNFFLFGAIALLLAGGGFVFSRFRVTRRQGQVIEEQKKIVDEAYMQLEEKNSEILDSITYAKRIQSAILPPTKLVKEFLPESFILYKPKDIVAGDFYWMEVLDDQMLFAACDCTGHGVPGAMVSVVCHNGLNRSVREHGITDPGKILDKTRDIVIEEFQKSDQNVQDGMDVALVALQPAKAKDVSGKAKVKYAGANNPLWVIRRKNVIAKSEEEGLKQSPPDDSIQPVEIASDSAAQSPRNDGYELIEITADKQPIGRFHAPQPYKTHEIELEPWDSIYIFSDGFADQFGGPRGKKFKKSNFKKLLLSMQELPMEDQREAIDKAFTDWQGNKEQIDDVCVIGVRL